MPTRAVLFDLGNTLWHIPELPPRDNIRGETVRRILRLLQSWGIEPEEEHRFIGRDIRLAVGEANRTAYSGNCISPDFLTIVREVAAEKGLDLSRDKVDQLWNTWNIEGTFFGRRLFDDALHTLEALRDRGYRIACVTNRAFGGPAFVQEIESHGLADLFEVMAVSCHLGYMKPHPKIFEHTLDALDVAPHEAVMVGDLLRADVAGAQALGMTAVWRRHGQIKEEANGVQPDFVVQELAELLDLPCLAPNGQ
ncbi:MAG: HAD family hydrolase [Dehalococcoidia bacterium]